MTREQAINIIKDLSKSQGMYGRIYETIQDFDEDDFLKFDALVEPLHDSVDLVLFFES